MSAPMLTSAEQRSAARQLTLAMLALGLLVLGLVWRWLAPDQSGVSQLLLGVASLLVAVPVMRSAWYSLRFPSLHGITDQLIALAMLGAWHPADGLSRPAYLTYLALAGLGTLLTAAYLLLMVRRVCMGPAGPYEAPLPDLRAHEYAAFTPLAVLTLAAGLWPALVLNLTDPAVQHLLPGVAR